MELYVLTVLFKFWFPAHHNKHFNPNAKGLMALSAAQTVKQCIVGWLVNNELE
jgi:hypothetical protein